MPTTYLKLLPSLITGQTSFSEIQTLASSFYGIGQHLSSVVIYTSCFLLLSIHLEKIGIRKSLNFVLTLGLSCMNVGIYELIYNLLYSNLQNQMWTFSFAWKQGLNLFMFIFFAIIGILSLIYLFTLGYKPNFNRITKVLFACSILTYCLWIFYPLPITTITVDTTTGAWTNGPLFPQTMYAVDIDPTDNIAIGNPVYVGNDSLHLVNVLNKIFTSLTILSFAMIKRRNL